MNYKSKIANCYISIVKVCPNFIGIHRIARILDYLFGPFKIKINETIMINILLSSPMDTSYSEILSTAHKPIISIIKKLKHDDIFVDIGANIGFFSLIASSCIGEGGRVYSFEPSQREFIRLLSNIELNNTNNIFPFPLALSDKSGEVMLEIEPFHTGMNSIAEKFNISKKYRLVQASTADEILAQLISKKIKIIKIDVEGAEFKVLSGMRKILNEKLAEIVIVEITPKFLFNFGDTKEMIYELMKQQGYRAQINSNEWQYDEIFKVDD